MASPAQFAADNEPRRISVKLHIDSTVYRGKLALSDMNEDKFETAIRTLFPHHAGPISIDRYSDSSRDYIKIASQHSYKQLYRAAKAKSKLKFRVQTLQPESAPTLSTATENTPVTINTTVTVESEPASTDYTCEGSVSQTEAESQAEAAAAPTSKPVSPHDAIQQLFAQVSKLAEPLPEERPQPSFTTLPPDFLCMNPDTESFFARMALSANTTPKQEEQERPQSAKYQSRELPVDEPKNVTETKPREQPISESPASNGVPSPAHAGAYANSVVYPKAGPAFQICCNACSATIENDHWHCSQCEMGDFDLCLKCAEAGKRCQSDEHWMVRRKIGNGNIINSTFEVLSSTELKTGKNEEGPKVENTSALDMKPLKEAISAVASNSMASSLSAAQGLCKTVENETADMVSQCLANAFQSIKTQGDNMSIAPAPPVSAMTCDAHPYEQDTTDPVHHAVEALSSPPAYPWGAINMRTCNNCVRELSEDMFVHCESCADFDLCFNCFTANDHGHSAAHAFSAAAPNVELPNDVKPLLAAGRNMRHNACCDGCDKFIVGVRHKCLDCPDWDFCSDCMDTKAASHKGHRFIKLYDHIPMPDVTQRVNSNFIQHRGIYCDGPLCVTANSSSCITGVRYKCTICHDLDFCSRCESLPSNEHSKSHPMVMMKTPISHVNVSTFGSDAFGRRLPPMGDKMSTEQPAPALSLGSKRAFAELQPTKPVAAKTEAVAKPVEPVVVKAAKPEAAKPVEPETIKSAEPAKQSSRPIRIRLPKERKITPKAGSTRPPPPEVPALGPGSASTKVCGVAMPLFNCKRTDATATGPRYRVRSDEEFTYIFHLMNNGYTDWPAGSYLEFVGGAYMGKGPEGSKTYSHVIDRVVKVGEKVDYPIDLRAPSEGGLLASYWRLTMCDGSRIGDRFWCETSVDGPELVEEGFFPAQQYYSAADYIKEESDKKRVKSESMVADPVAPTPAMVFPTLETESPVSSITEHATTQSEAETVTEQSAAAPEASPTVVTQSDLGSLGDFEGGDDWTGSDIDFLTDEEYDILDNSDEDYSTL